jgi:tetrahydromethanopterin S-methyltransferase subunit G
VANVNNKDIDLLIDVFDIVSEHANWNEVRRDLDERGFTEAEVDAALKRIGATVGRDFGLL